MSAIAASEYAWTCGACRTENDLDRDVAELAIETWTTCEGCGSHATVDLRGFER